MTKTLKFILTTLIVFGLMHIYTSISSKEEHPNHIPLSNPVLDQFVNDFEGLAHNLFTKSKAPGAAIALVKDGRIIYVEGLGVKESGKTDSIDIHTVFRIGSVSKTFAGVLTGKLVHQNALRWDDRVKDYLPDFELKNPEYTSLLEVKHILSQSTGLIQHAYTNFIEEGKDLSVMIAALKDVKLMTEPGKLYSYQNVAYGIIEPLLQSATGVSYNDLMKKEIFRPLGMRDASLDYTSMLANENKAFPNYPRRYGWAVGRIHQTYYNVPSAGGVNASIYDMAHYMLALTGHRPDVIDPVVLDDIFQPQIRTRIRWKYFSRWRSYKKSWYGLGWRIVDNGDYTVAYHGGYVNGFRSQIAVVPGEDIGICVLTNSPTNFSSKLVPEFLKLYDLYKDSLIQEKDDQISKVAVQ